MCGFSHDIITLLLHAHQGSMLRNEVCLLADIGHTWYAVPAEIREVVQTGVYVCVCVLPEYAWLCNILRLADTFYCRSPVFRFNHKSLIFLLCSVVDPPGVEKWGEMSCSLTLSHTHTHTHPHSTLRLLLLSAPSFLMSLFQPSWPERWWHCQWRASPFTLQDVQSPMIYSHIYPSIYLSDFVRKYTWTKFYNHSANILYVWN